MHKSYILDRDGHKVVLQELGKAFGAIPDTTKICEFLEGKFPTTKLLKWRVVEYIEGDTVTNPSNSQLRSAVKLLIKFHSKTASFLAEPFNMHKVPELEKEYEELRKLQLPIRTVHGDVKCNNFIYKGDRAVALIDLDYVHNNTIVWDIANMICSWCGCENGTIDIKKVEIIKSEFKKHINRSEYEAIDKFVLVYAREFYHRHKDYNYFKNLTREYCDYRSNNALKFYQLYKETICHN